MAVNNITKHSYGYAFSLIFQLNGTVSSTEAHQMQHHVPCVYRRYQNITIKYLNGVSSDTGQNCTLLICFQVTSSFRDIHGYLSESAYLLPQDEYASRVVNVSAVLDNGLLLESVQNISTITCVTADRVGNPRYIRPYFDVYHEYDLPCPAVRVYRHFTEKSAKVWYSLPGNKPTFAETDVVRVDDAYFVCTHTYMTSYKMKATAGSGCCHGRCQTVIAVWIMQLFMLHYTFYLVG